MAVEVQGGTRTFPFKLALPRSEGILPDYYDERELKDKLTPNLSIPLGVPITLVDSTVDKRLLLKAGIAGADRTGKLFYRPKPFEVITDDIKRLLDQHNVELRDGDWTSQEGDASNYDFLRRYNNRMDNQFYLAHLGLSLGVDSLTSGKVSQEEFEAETASFLAHGIAEVPSDYISRLAKMKAASVIAEGNALNSMLHPEVSVRNSIIFAAQTLSDIKSMASSGYMQIIDGLYRERIARVVDPLNSSRTGLDLLMEVEKRLP